MSRTDHKKKDPILVTLTFLFVLFVLSVLAFYSQKGFCIAISQSYLPQYIGHSILQGLSGGPIGLYGLAWYIASPEKSRLFPELRM